MRRIEVILIILLICSCAGCIDGGHDNGGHNRKPVSAIHTSTNVTYQHNNITFDASQSRDPEGMELTYLWNLGDGNSSDDVVVVHRFPTIGNYTVSLTVTDPQGRYNISYVEVSIKNALDMKLSSLGADDTHIGMSINVTNHSELDIELCKKDEWRWTLETKEGITLGDDGEVAGGGDYPASKPIEISHNDSLQIWLMFIVKESLTPTVLNYEHQVYSYSLSLTE